MKIDYRIQNPITTKVPTDIKHRVVKNKEDGTDLKKQIQKPLKQRINRTTRSDEQFRQIFMKTGVVTQASGSSYIEIEQTKIICSVHGPRATLKTELFETAKLNCELKYATFSTNNERSDYLESTKEKDYSLIITQAIIGAIRLEKYPKAAIDIYILVLSDDGSILPAAIIAASMALADAGVEMYDLVAACSSVCLQDNVLLDPTNNEESQDNVGHVIVSKMPSHNEITQLLQTGELSYTNIVDGIDLCIDGCDKIYSMMKQNLIDSLQRQLTKKQEEESLNGDE